MWLGGGPDGRGGTGRQARHLEGRREAEQRETAASAGPQQRSWDGERWVYAATIGKISLNLVIAAWRGTGASTAGEGRLRRVTVAPAAEGDNDRSEALCGDSGGLSRMLVNSCINPSGARQKVLGCRSKFERHQHINGDCIFT